MSKRSVTIAIATVTFTAAVIAVAAQTITFESVISTVEQMGGLKFNPHPNLEKVESNEAANIVDTAVSMFRIQMAKEPQSRDAHAKGHGCAEAEFTVNPNLPANLRAGVFAEPGQTFDALIRFSNGQGSTTGDAIPQGHGMAIKLIGAVKGGNLLGTGDTQDFMLVDNPRFLVRSAKDYALLERAVLQDHKPDRYILFRAIREALAAAGRADAEDFSDEGVAQIAAGIVALQSAPQALSQTLTNLFGSQAMAVQKALFVELAQMKAGKAPLEAVIAPELNKVIGSSLAVPYFSMTSYLFRTGNYADTAVKYSARPVDCNTGKPVSSRVVPAKPEENFLAIDLSTSLKREQACFEFFVQTLPADVSTDKRKTLVEDARLSYGTSEIPVARIVIPVQDTSLSGKQAYCENLSYNPWQATASQQPLGALNRARKVAVTASSIRRHLFTGKERQEPTTVQEYRSLR